MVLEGWSVGPVCLGRTSQWQECLMEAALHAWHIESRAKETQEETMAVYDL